MASLALRCVSCAGPAWHRGDEGEAGQGGMLIAEARAGAPQSCFSEDEVLNFMRASDLSSAIPAQSSGRVFISLNKN